MTAVDLIRTALTNTRAITMPLIDDMRDAPLTFPTQNGGNHPLWVMGHLAYAEGRLVQNIMQGKENPLEEWKPIFGPGSEPHQDASAYPDMDTVLAQFEKLRGQTLALLDELTDEDLDRKSAACPEGREAFFGTWGVCLLTIAMHTANHRGQVSDARRAAGRERVMG